MNLHKQWIANVDANFRAGSPSVRWWKLVPDGQGLAGAYQPGAAQTTGKAENVIRQIVSALATDDRTALDKLSIEQSEFKYMWPGLPPEVWIEHKPGEVLSDVPEGEPDRRGRSRRQSGGKEVGNHQGQLAACSTEGQGISTPWPDVVSFASLTKLARRE